MPNVTLEQAKALSAVPCPACGGTGFIFVPGSVPDQDKCEPCDGRGTLAFPSEWPQVLWIDFGNGFGLHLWPEAPAHSRPRWLPAPDPIRALMWLEKVGMILMLDLTDGTWGALMALPNTWLGADTPEALLDAVLAALTRTPSASL